MPRLLPILFAACLLLGCSFWDNTPHYEGTPVQGFGTGATQAEAQKAAWDDAMTRVRAMGMQMDQAQTAAPAARVNGNGAATDPGHRGEAGRYQATVTVYVQDKTPRK
jgi:hypothetical protein